MVTALLRTFRFKSRRRLSTFPRLQNDVRSTLQPASFPLINYPEVHVLQGFSPYRPVPKVIEVIRDRVNSEPWAQDSAYPTQQESFYVLDLDRVRYKHSLWQHYLPDVSAHYAVKSNPNPAILKLMANQLNMSFDCASQSEIESILSLGVSPERVIFANPCKPMSHIDYARKNGVFKTTFDSESELLKIKLMGDSSLWQLVLRIWVDDKDSQCQLSNKYGAHLHECAGLLELAKKLGLQVVGISFHVGSGAKTAAFGQAFEASQYVFQLGTDMGHPMRLIDIGGGFPGTCSSDGPSLAGIAKVLRPHLKNVKGTELIAEPGRYFCAEAQTLATQIIGKRVRRSGNHQSLDPPIEGSLGLIREYYINEGLYQSFNCMLYDHSVLLQEPEEDSHRSAIFGQTCDGLDQISKEIFLPDLRVGDWLVFPNMGAYTNGACSQFNGFSLNDWVIVDGENDSS